MSTLWRKTFRDLLGARWQAGGLALLVAVVVALMAGAGRARGMMVASRDAPLERLKAADLDVRCSPTLPGALYTVKDLDGIAVMEERMVLEGMLRAPDMPATSTVVRILPEGAQPKLFQLEILAGRLPEAGEEALLIDRSVARHRNVAVGDRVEIEVLDVRRTFPVVGVVLDAEHLLHPAHPDFEVPIPGALAAVYASHAAATHLPFADRVDSLLFRFAQDADAAALEQQIRERLSVAILAIIPATQQRSFRMTNMIIAVFDVYMPTVATILIAVALALFVITISRLVRRQRPQIGALLAIGQRPLTIAVSMLGLSVVPTVIGGLIGAGGHNVMAVLIFDAHANAVGWPLMADPGPGPEVLVTLLACAGVAVVACFVPALLTARRMPAQLLSHDSWDTLHRQQGFLVTLAAKLRDVLRLPLHVVLGLSTVLRRRWATATAALALAANFAVVLAFLFVHLSHSEEVRLTFDRLGLDATAYFARPVPDDVIHAAAQPEWTKVEPLISRIAWVEMDSGPAFVRLTCLEADGWISQWPIAAGRAFSAPDAHELHIDHWTADIFGLSLGDRVLCFPYYSAPEGLELEVVGIFGGVSMGVNVIPLQTARVLYELPDLCTGVNVSSTSSREELLGSLRRLPEVESVTYLSDARDHVQRTFSASRFVLTLAMSLAVIVAVIFLGILASLDASERSRDLAILRALGWRDRTVFGLCITEVVARGYLALLISLPSAPFVARWILSRITEANHYRMPLHDPAWVYLTVGVLGAILIPLGAIPAWRVAQSMPPARIARLLGRE